MKEETKEAFWFLKFTHSIHITASIVLFSYQRLLNAKNFSHFKQTFSSFSWWQWQPAVKLKLKLKFEQQTNCFQPSFLTKWKRAETKKKLNRKWMFNMLRHLLNFSFCSRKMKKSYFLLENEILSAWFISWTFPSATVANMRHLFS